MRREDLQKSARLFIERLFLRLKMSSHENKTLGSDANLDLVGENLILERGSRPFFDLHLTSNEHRF